MTSCRVEANAYWTDPVFTGADDVGDDVFAGRRKRVRFGRLTTQAVHDLLQMSSVAEQRYLAVLRDDIDASTPGASSVLKTWGGQHAEPGSRSS